MHAGAKRAASEGSSSRRDAFEVYGLDLVLDETLRPWLVEVNSHPAIGDGTMHAVDPSVYTGLVADVVALLVDNENDKKTTPAAAAAADDGFEPIALPSPPSPRAD